MKKLLINSLLLITILISLPISAQQIGDVIDPNFMNRQLWKEENSNIKGSPFYFDEWYSGEIMTKIGTSYPNMKIKYEAYSDQLFFLSEDNIERALAREKINWFQFNDAEGNSYLFKHIPYHGFLQVLYDGDVSLYKKIAKEIRKAPEANGYNATTKQDEFIEKQIYFVASSPEATIVPIDKRNEYLELFSSNEDKIKKFIKKNKVKFKEDANIIDLVKFTEQLRSEE
ncbi:hypothetical protein [Ekhidna sp.]|uniref:hypothetical protein n=1 Tax=Ekhidna sp. TaxID=2608089 RepID=UPI003CCC44A2